jgi:hypothetical protein
LQGDFHFVRDAKSFYHSLRIERISANKASTFNGFCDYHDTKSFDRLDNLDLSDPKLFFSQLMYRAVAFEKYRKLVAVEFSEEIHLLDKGRPLPDQMQIQFDAMFAKWSHGQGLAHLNLLFASIEKVLSSRNFDDVKYSYFVTDKKLPFAGIGVFQPSRGVDGEYLQRVNLIYHREIFGELAAPESVCIAAVPMATSTLLCLCALSRQKKALGFISSLIAQEEAFASRFLGVLLLSIENVYFMPSYINSIDPPSLAKLKRLSSLGIAEDLRAEDMDLAMSVDLFDDVSISLKLSN